MKIVGFKDFVNYPAGTIFSYYEPHPRRWAVFHGLWRKEDTIYTDDSGIYPDDCPNRACDYFQQSLLPSLENDQEDKVVIGGIERWGEFEWDQQYAIYEDEDLDTLKKLLG
jgi:hypothetical protein